MSNQLISVLGLTLNDSILIRQKYQFFVNCSEFFDSPIMTFSKTYCDIVFGLCMIERERDKRGIPNLLRI